MASAAPTGYRVDDLDWLRAELGIAHLELDPWGSVLVTPATDEHERAGALLVHQLVAQLEVAGSVRVNSLAWKVPGGSGDPNVPDIAVVSPAFVRVGTGHLEPPPALIVEVASPSTRGIDRGRKLADYRLGGAGLYLLVDLPGLSAVTEVAFEAHDFVEERLYTAAGRIKLVVNHRPVLLDLTRLPGTG